MKEKIKFLKVRDVATPTRATSLSAGIDFYVPTEFSNSEIKPGQSVLIPSGIKVNFNDDYALIAFNKSGVALKKNLQVGAAVVDADYQGEIHIHLTNVGTEIQNISAGEKIIQFLLVPIIYADIEEVTSEEELFETKSERGTGGFGSTGTLSTHPITKLLLKETEPIFDSNIAESAIDKNKSWKIDFDRIKNIDDVKTILQTLDITFSGSKFENSSITSYLKEI